VQKLRRQRNLLGVLLSRGSTASTFYLFFVTATRRSIWKLIRVCTYVQKVIFKVADRHSVRPLWHVMKLHFPNHNECSEIRAVLTVMAVLMIGMLAKFDAMQLFHLSR
jgi:hypothetical protein